MDHLIQQSDPTALTTAQLSRATADLKGLLEQQLAAQSRLMDERDLRYDQRFRAQTEAVSTAMTAAEKAVAAALSAADRAVLKAENASEKRFEAVNEFRQSLNDMMTQLIPRSEADQRFDAMAEKIGTLQQRLDKAEGTGGGLRAGWGYLIGGVGLFSTIVGLLLFSVKGGAGPSMPPTAPAVPQVVYVPSPPAVMPTTPAK